MKKALVASLLLFGMVAQANPGTDKEVLEYRKKAIYYEIKAKLEAGEISIEQAQAQWQKRVKQLLKEEGK